MQRRNENVIELDVAKGDAEQTLQNNRAVVVVNGVRDRMRVLLVSGQPHAGERVWRDLLKADPSVDREMIRELKRLRQQANAPDLPPAVKRTGKV